MERARICFPSVVFPEQVCEQEDHEDHAVSTQSFGHGASQATGIGKMASLHSCLFTSSPGKDITTNSLSLLDSCKMGN
jgi:hypothetical protein